MSVKTGIPGPWVQPSTYGRTQAGQFATVPYEDVDPNKINALAAKFDALGYTYQVEHGFGKTKVTVQLPYNPDVQQEVPVDLWEYVSMGSQTDILDALTPSGFTTDLTVKQKEAIRWVLANRPGFDPSTANSGNLSNDFTISTSWIAVFGVQDPTLNVDCDKCAAVYAVIADGTDTFEFDDPVLTRKQIVSPQYTLKLNLDNIGKILTTEKVLEEAAGTMPENIAGNLPLFTQDKTTKQYGWKKLFPSIQQIAWKKIQIDQQYRWGKWDTRVFGALVKPTT